MKKYLLWSFERGSRPYDAICFAILAFIFLTPTGFFHDRPDFMRIDENEAVRRTKDDTGHIVYTVRLNTPPFVARAAAEKAAVEQLRAVVHEKFEVSRSVPIYDSKGIIVGYSLWIDTGPQPF